MEGAAQNAVEGKQRQIAESEAKRKELEDQRTERKEAILEPPTQPRQVVQTDDSYDKLDALHAGMTSVLPQEIVEKPWWQKTLDFVDKHQTEIAIGVGVTAGVLAIVLTAGTATPFVVAAGGAMLAAGGVVTAGTVGLNAYYGRPLGQNVLQNVTASAVTALVTTGAAWFLTSGISTVGNSLAGYCVLNPSVCGRTEVVMNVVDKLEEAGLMVKGTIQTWRGDSAGAADTALELQLEYLDGGMPGNTVVKEMGNELQKLGPDAVGIAERYGDDAIPLLLKYGDDAVDLLKKGSPALDDWTKYVPDKYHDDVIVAFDDNPLAITLTENVSVYRYWSNPDKQSGVWTTLDPNLSPEEARSLLALPDDKVVRHKFLET